MENGLVWVRFKNGKLRELSSHIANDKQHQKTMGFEPVNATPEVPIISEVKKKIENHAAEEIEANIKTADLDSPPAEAELIPEKKKRGRKPKQ